MRASNACGVAPYVASSTRAWTSPPSTLGRSSATTTSLASAALPPYPTSETVGASAGIVTHLRTGLFLRIGTRLRTRFQLSVSLLVDHFLAHPYAPMADHH